MSIMSALRNASVVLLGLCILAGCQRKLFNEKVPRNQFETHDRLRQEFEPLEIPNEFGEMEPALRSRLAPRS